MLTYLFDIDGTLTEPRKKITQEFALFFEEWSKSKDIRLVTGSDYFKTKEQLGFDLWSKYIVYQCSGNQIFANGKLVYEYCWKYPEKLIDFLENKLKKSSSPWRCGNHIEIRMGMINFSTIGRDCSQEQRDKYFMWDNYSNERDEICKEINKKFKKYNIVAQKGGQISIDIFEATKSKGQVLDFMGGKTNDIIFFGDKAFPGGNDWDIAKRIPSENVIEVKGPQETLKILKSWK